MLSGLQVNPKETLTPGIASRAYHGVFFLLREVLVVHPWVHCKHECFTTHVSLPPTFLLQRKGCLQIDAEYQRVTALIDAFF